MPEKTCKIETLSLVHIRRVPDLPEDSSLALILSRTFCHYLLMMLSFFLFFFLSLE